MRRSERVVRRRLGFAGPGQPRLEPVPAQPYGEYEGHVDGGHYDQPLDEWDD